MQKCKILIFKIFPQTLKNFIKILFRCIQLGYKKIVIIDLTEHLGDIVACEPVARNIRAQSPQAWIIWIVNNKYKDVVAYNSNISQVIGVSCLSEWIFLKKLLPAKCKIVDLHIDGRICTKYGFRLSNPNKYGITLENYYQYGNLIRCFAKAAGISTLPDETPFFHFCENIQLPNLTAHPYIVIHPTSNEVDRDWDTAKWNVLLRHIIKQYGMDIYEIGITPVVGIVDRQYHTMCGKLTLQQIALLIKKSHLFIGIDSAFAHFANAVNTPGVILLGHYRVFKKYMPYSGNYANGKNASIIQYDGPVAEIPVALVLDKIKERIYAKN